MDGRERHLRDAHDAARKVERWASISMWGSGCALVGYGLALLIALAVAVWVVVALR